MKVFYSIILVLALFSKTVIANNPLFTNSVNNIELSNVSPNTEENSKYKKSISYVSQQSKTVTGVVFDEKKISMPGVSVFEKGTTNGTITDGEGKYSLKVKSSSVIVFSFIGYKTQEITVGDKTKIDVVLGPDVTDLDEVVVTAMGIQRKAKSLTYATQTINNKEMTRAKSPNFINSLQGKSAGLTITPNSSGAGGGSSKILLRGQSSMLGNNQPLIVLDGIPLSNGMSGQTKSLQYAGSVDNGDILSTINPDDIASISILKGANSAALYGSAANNGVIIITTKSGREGKARVDFSSSVNMETPLILPEFQSDYGGKITNAHTMIFDGWGPKISEITDEQLASLPYATRKVRNKVREFLRPGLTFNNSISINGGTKATKAYFSYANTNQKGLLTNNDFNRHNVTFKQGFGLFNEVLKLDLSINYIHQITKNSPALGKGLNPLYSLYRTPANVDMRYFKENYQHKALADDEMVLGRPEATNKKLLGHQIQTWPWFTQWVNNPYWMVNKVDNRYTKQRILASVTANVDLIKDLLTLQGRFSVDNNMSKTVNKEDATLNREARGRAGMYYSGRGERIDLFGDVLATINKKISDNIDFNATVGTSTKRIKNRYLGVHNAIDTAGMVNVFLPQNSRKNLIESSTYSNESWSSNWEAAVFATAQFGFAEKAFIDFSFRNDWSQAFQQFAKEGEYKSFPYYSFGGNMLVHKFIPKISNVLDYLKFRVSYSEVGNSIPNVIYSAQSIDFSTGAITARSPSFDDPKPETTKAIEAGVEGAALHNKLDFDFTLYQTTMENQFMYITTAAGQSKPINSGKVRNRGFEATLGYMVLERSDWRWKSGFNFAINDNTIITTYKPAEKGATAQIIQMGDAAFKIKFIEGGAYGDLYVNSFSKDKDGKIKLNSQGAPLMTTGKFETFVGNATAKVNLGWNNTVSYKNFSLYMLIDGKIGGKVMSLTQADLDAFGLSKKTGDARNNGGKVILPDGSGREVNAELYYKTIGQNPMEEYVYDATNFRLREMSLGYTFRELLGPSKDLSLSLVGRNLGFFYKDAPVDPDISMSAANGFGGIDVYALPTTRTFGLNVKVSF